MDGDLELGDALPAPAGPRVVRLPLARLAASPTGRRVRTWTTATVVAVLATGACVGAGPLPDPGASFLRTVAADATPDGSGAPDGDAARDAAGSLGYRDAGERHGPVDGPPVVEPASLATAVPAAPPVVLAVDVPVPPPVVPPAVSALTRSGIPESALAAYRSAAASLAAADPGCRLDWSLLAGIGRVETNHGQFGGRRPTADGAVLPPILGLPLDGRPGTRAILDTDGGRLDGDLVHDRAVGPMQFIPGTWARWGADGDGTGTADPHDLDDAALGAARYLCAGDRDLSTAAGRDAAAFSYNRSLDYVRLVTALADAYRSITELTGPPPLTVPVPDGPSGLPGAPASVTPPVISPDPVPPTSPSSTSPSSTSPSSTSPSSTSPSSTSPSSTSPSSTSPSSTSPSSTSPSSTSPSSTSPSSTSSTPSTSPSTGTSSTSSTASTESSPAP